MALAPALTSSKSDEWATPPDLYNVVCALVGPCDLDAAATLHNRVTPRYFAVEDDALDRPWIADRVWCNPPYSRISAFTQKAMHEARCANNLEVVLLVPARTDTKWWHELMAMAARVFFLKGRVRFIDPTGATPASAPFPSAVVVVSNRARLGQERSVVWLDWQQMADLVTRQIEVAP